MHPERKEVFPFAPDPEKGRRKKERLRTQCGGAGGADLEL